MPLGIVALPERVVPLLTWVLATWVVGRLVVRDAPRFRLARPDVAGLTSGTVLIALASARVAAMAPYWRIVLAHPIDLLRVTDRLSLAGGIVGALGGFLLLSRHAGLPLAAAGDLVGSALPLGMAVYSAACVGRGDCFGRAADPPLGVIFPGLRTPRYPVELYATAGALLIAGGLGLLRRRALPAGGRGLLAIAALAALWRALEALRLRPDTAAVALDRATVLVIAVAAVATLAWRMGRPPRGEEFTAQARTTPAEPYGGMLP